MNLSHGKTESGVAYVMMPPQSGGPAPTLLLLAMAGPGTLTTEPYRRVGALLHEKGWNVVSLDLPCHGDDRRPNEPAEIVGWATRLAAGENIVETFRERVNQVLEHLIESKLANPSRIGVAGTSRGGFLAFHAATGNARIGAVAAFAPVADLPALTEFTGLKENALVKSLALVRTAESLADRAAWIVIGNADARVDTDKTIEFSRALVRAASTRGLRPRTTLLVLPVPGHSSIPAWHDLGADWFECLTTSKE